jgi:cyclopropane fatty-acyl-phospholipid synthase-like methyltransferase
VLSRVVIQSYTAFDFSAPMHALARERLGESLCRHVQFLEADFKHPGWTEGLGRFDAVVTMQAVHELRHKRHAPGFYRNVQGLLRRGGVLLVCDHIRGEGGTMDTALYMTVEEHEAALRTGGFASTALLLKKGGLALFRAESR